MLTKFACTNLAAKCSAVKLLNSRVVVYLLWPGILFSTAVRAKLVILGILILTSFILALRAALVAKLVILSISFLTSFILALRVVLVANLVISGILSSLSLILALYTSFLTRSFFTTSLSLLKSTRTGTILSTANLSTLLLKLLKLLGTFFNSSISKLSTSDFKLAKSVFLAKSDVSTPVAIFKSAFVA